MNMTSLERLLSIIALSLLICSVDTAQTPSRRTPVSLPPQKQQPLSDLIKRIKPAVVSVVTFDDKGEKLALGSGFFIEPTIVVTNQHVIERASRVELKTSDGHTYSVLGLVALGEETDLVLLRVDISNSQIIPLRTADELPPEGERVFVIGNPRGLEWSVSDGIVAAIRDDEHNGKIIQITAPISSGSSGSPVINSKGQVIGIATSALVNGQNLNFAIPSNQIGLLRRGEIRTLSTYYEETKKSRREESEQYRRSGATIWSKDIGVEGSKAALPDYEKAVAIDPENGLAWDYLGSALADLGRYAEAIDARKKSIELEEEVYLASNSIDDLSDLFTVHYSLGKDYLKTANPLGASDQLKILRRLLDLIPSAKPSRKRQDKSNTFKILAIFADNLQRDIQKYLRNLD